MGVPCRKCVDPLNCYNRTDKRNNEKTTMADNKKSSIVYESQESLYAKAVRTMEMDKLIVQFAFKEENYCKAAEMFEEVGDYLDAPQLAAECRRLAESTQEEAKKYQYQRALTQKKEAKSAKGYEKAEKMFQEICGYQDSQQQMEECRRCREQLQKKRKRKKAGKGLGLLAVVLAVAAFFLSPQWNTLWTKLLIRVEASSKEKLPSLKAAEAGELVEFGGYQWYVLEKQNSAAKLILYHAEQVEELRYRAYHEKQEAVTWEDCSLREWLNHDFLNTVFSEKEQERILLTDVPNEKNETYGTDGGEDTQDKVFLLSEKEAKQYQDILKSLKIAFWLRTPGASPDTAAYMSVRPRIMDYGYPVSSPNLYTCPVICVSIE